MVADTAAEGAPHWRAYAQSSGEHAGDALDPVEVTPDLLCAQGIDP